MTRSIRRELGQSMPADELGKVLAADTGESRRKAEARRYGIAAEQAVRLHEHAPWTFHGYRRNQ